MEDARQLTEASGTPQGKEVDGDEKPRTEVDERNGAAGQEEGRKETKYSRDPLFTGAESTQGKGEEPGRRTNTPEDKGRTETEERKKRRQPNEGTQGIQESIKNGKTYGPHQPEPKGIGEGGNPEPIALPQEPPEGQYEAERSPEPGEDT